MISRTQPDSRLTRENGLEAFSQQDEIPVQGIALKRSRDGQQVTDVFEAGLIREDRAYLYPIVDGIPKMLIESAIPLSEFGA